MQFTPESLLHEAKLSNARADRARGSQVENVSDESYHRGCSHTYQKLAMILVTQQKGKHEE